MCKVFEVTEKKVKIKIDFLQIKKATKSKNIEKVCYDIIKVEYY